MRPTLYGSIVLLASACARAPSAPKPVAPVAVAVPTQGQIDRLGFKQRREFVAATAALNLQQCYELPPAGGPLHVSIVVESSGHVERVHADSPFSGTPAGDCAEALFRGIRIEPFEGGPMKFGSSVPHAPVRGDPTDPPFDAEAIRRQVPSLSLADCAQYRGDGSGYGRATIATVPKGAVAAVSVEGPLGSTPRGWCIGATFRHGLHVRPYSGDPTRVDVAFDVPRAE